MEGLKKAAYDLYLDHNDVEDSADAQVQFMYDSIYNIESLPDSVLDLMSEDKGKSDIVGHGNIEKLKKVFESGSSGEVAEAFMNRWEKPRVTHLDRRLEETQKRMPFE
ncbi:uncharacterized protein METZ01_LOCUS282345 [marine metagenome]|uniref:Uncharacterized protein n=1 Tax=marine metagenome TaxID=408172 RepID=A0A382L3M4_9ZZZZ